MRGFRTASSLAVVLSLGLGLGAGGCGGCNDNNDVGHLPDAPPAPDGSPPDAVDPAAVALTIVRNGAPAVGVTVYFLNADDSLALSTITDAMGIARAKVAAGGSVTAINPFTTMPAPTGVGVPDELRTFVGVKPGDRLVLSHDTNDVSFALQAPGVEGGQSYQIATTCGAPALASPPGVTRAARRAGARVVAADPSGMYTVAHCDGTADIAIVAFGSENVPLSGLYHRDAALSPTVDLTADTYDTLTDISFTYTNLPDLGMSAQHWLTVGRGNLGPFPVDVGNSTSSVPHATLDNAMGLIIETTLSSGFGFEHDVLDWGPAATSYNLDAMGQLLPDLLTSPAFDAATGKVTWTEGAQGAAPDLTAAAIGVTRNKQWHWEIVAPYKQGEIRFPHLPTDRFDWNPASEDVVVAEQVMNAEVPGGYDAVRAHILDIRDLSVQSPDVGGQSDLSPFVDGNAGRVVLVQSLPPPP